MDASIDTPRGRADGARAPAGGGSGIIRDPMGPETGLNFELMEALFFAYRDFISSADRDLETLGFGRAHHRVLHFVNRDPGLSVAQLLEPLAITKQSLARVLKQLVDAGLVVQRAGEGDRRQRQLFPTPKGRALTLSLAAPQSRRIEEALGELGTGSEDARRTVERFLRAMVGPERAEAPRTPMPPSPDAPDDRERRDDPKRRGDRAREGRP